MLKLGRLYDTSKCLTYLPHRENVTNYLRGTKLQNNLCSLSFRLLQLQKILHKFQATLCGWMNLFSLFFLPLSVVNIHPFWSSPPIHVPTVPADNFCGFEWKVEVVDAPHIPTQRRHTFRIPFSCLESTNEEHIT